MMGSGLCPGGEGTHSGPLCVDTQGIDGCCRLLHKAAMGAGCGAGWPCITTFFSQEAGSPQFPHQEVEAAPGPDSRLGTKPSLNCIAGRPQGRRLWPAPPCTSLSWTLLVSAVVFCACPSLRPRPHPPSKFHASGGGPHCQCRARLAAAGPARSHCRHAGPALESQPPSAQTVAH